jgi:hypothetical protein
VGVLSAGRRLPRKADAESMKAKLALLGFEATYPNVRPIPARCIACASALRPDGNNEPCAYKLSDNGVDVAVVRIGK